MTETFLSTFDHLYYFNPITHTEWRYVIDSKTSIFEDFYHINSNGYIITFEQEKSDFHFQQVSLKEGFCNLLLWNLPRLQNNSQYPIEHSDYKIFDDFRNLIKVRFYSNGSIFVDASWGATLTQKTLNYLGENIDGRNFKKDR
jgi:regulatory protein YycI of two-component signal transduction system YycFG